MRSGDKNPIRRQFSQNLVKRTNTTTNFDLRYIPHTHRFSVSSLMKPPIRLLGLHHNLIIILQEPRRRDNHHQRIRQLLDSGVESIVARRATNARTALQRMRNQHAVVGEELPPLGDVVAAAAEEGSPNDAGNLGEEVVVLLEGGRVLGVGLEFGVGGEEARELDGAEEVGVDDVFGAGAGLGELEEEGEESVEVVLLLFGAWGC